jgi:hypothetical protein
MSLTFGQQLGDSIFDPALYQLRKHYLIRLNDRLDATKVIRIEKRKLERARTGNPAPALIRDLGAETGDRVVAETVAGLDGVGARLLARHAVRGLGGAREISHAL